MAEGILIYRADAPTALDEVVPVDGLHEVDLDDRWILEGRLGKEETVL